MTKDIVFHRDDVDLLQSNAIITPCERYRLALWRRIADRGSSIDLMIGLNPSTADWKKDDRTSAKFQYFAKRDGYAVAVMVNLYAVRATKPEAIFTSDDPVGYQNDAWVEWFALRADRILCAWGSHKAVSWRGRDARIKRILKNVLEYRKQEPPVFGVFGLTEAGHPKHPLYLPNSTLVQPWSL